MDVFRLLAGTVALRPYVFVFLAVYLFAAVTKLGWARTAAYTVVAWAIAFAAELSSTRNGFPFGMYAYVDATRDRELWLSNVPFFDSLSFSFLCYLGYALAVFLYAPLVVGRGDFQVAETRAIRTAPSVLVTGAFLTMLLDWVIDPLTLLGERWFLGRIGGLVEPLLYFGVVAFNLAITFSIGERLLGLLGCMLYAPVVVLFVAHPLNPARRADVGDVVRHRRDFPDSAIVTGGEPEARLAS